jgi:hypothetical protein
MKMPVALAVTVAGHLMDHGISRLRAKSVEPSRRRCLCGSKIDHILV